MDLHGPAQRSTVLWRVVNYMGGLADTLSVKGQRVVAMLSHNAAQSTCSCARWDARTISTEQGACVATACETDPSMNLFTFP